MHSIVYGDVVLKEKWGAFPKEWDVSIRSRLVEERLHGLSGVRRNFPRIIFWHVLRFGLKLMHLQKCNEIVKINRKLVQLSQKL